MYILPWPKKKMRQPRMPHYKRVHARESTRLYPLTRLSHFFWPGVVRVSFSHLDIGLTSAKNEWQPKVPLIELCRQFYNYSNVFTKLTCAGRRSSAPASVSLTRPACRATQHKADIASRVDSCAIHWTGWLSTHFTIGGIRKSWTRND